MIWLYKQACSPMLLFSDFVYVNVQDQVRHREMRRSGVSMSMSETDLDIEMCPF
jgi:hypothetical protein